LYRSENTFNLDVGTSAVAEALIARGTDSDLRIDDPGISRNHAELRRSGGDVTVVDLGSTNGVVVDGQPVGEQRLKDGARVQLGSTTMIFHDGRRR